MKRNFSRIICLGGILSAIAIFLHSAPVFMPDLGLLLSPLSTLPIAIAVICLRSWGILSYLCAACVLFFISPQEAVIFLTTTGLLGLVLGFLMEKKRLIVTMIAGASLFLGMCLLMFIIGIPAFGGFLAAFSFLARVGTCVAFSFLYAWVWVMILRKLNKLIDNANHQV